MAQKSLWSFCDYVATSNINNELKASAPHCFCKLSYHVNATKINLIPDFLSSPTLKYLVHLFYELCILVLSRNRWIELNLCYCINYWVVNNLHGIIVRIRLMSYSNSLLIKAKSTSFFSMYKFWIKEMRKYS